MSTATRCRRHSNSSFASMAAAWAGDILPVGTVDYSDALTNAAAFRPKVLIDLMGGEDQVNSLKQIASFGLAHEHGGRRRSVRAGEHLIRARRSAGRLVDHGMVVESTRRPWRSKRSTPPSAAAPARPRARAIGSAMPGSARLRRSPIRRSRSMPSSSPARCRDTHCPRISRSIPIAHLSARLTTN